MKLPSLNVLKMSGLLFAKGGVPNKKGGRPVQVKDCLTREDSSDEEGGETLALTW